MSKENHVPRTLKQAAKIAGYHCKEVEAMALDVGKKIISDQSEWLDSVMKDLMPPRLYEAGRNMELQDEIAEYARKHGISVVFIPDSLRIQVLLKGKLHSEFRPQLMVDGEPVSMTPQIPLDGSQN